MMENTDRKSGRNSDGTFAEGNPGKPRGSRHKVTQAVEALLEGQAETLTEKAVAMALEGDSTAMRLCLERIAPARKDAPVEFDLPEITTAQNAADAAAAVLRAVSDGMVSPLEGATLMALVDSFRRALEASEFERRIAALEGSS